jgi:hypothetical protein
VKRRIQSATLLFLLAAICAPAFALHSYVAPRRAHRVRRAHLRRLRWNPVFRPSRESLLLQNHEIDRMDLPRIQDDAELEQLKASEDLVPIVAGPTLRFDPRLDPDRRYCRPWTREFLDDMSAAYYKRFQTSIQVNSAVRNGEGAEETSPPQSQCRARRRRDRFFTSRRRHGGHSAARVEPRTDQVGPGLYAASERTRLIEPEEERRQWVFHVMVSGRYTDWRESMMLAGEQPIPQASETAELPLQ